MGNGMPIPYLVNPQSDMTPPSHVHQTVKHAIDFTRRSDFWMDDASSPQHHRPTATEQRIREFRYPDGCQTAATSEASSLTFVAELAGPKTHECLEQKALDSHPKTSTAMEEGEKKEDKKKEGGDEEHMDEGIVPEDSQSKDAASGEDKGGGSGTAA